MNIEVNYSMLERLERLEDRVAEIIEEFEQASSRRADLVADAGRPDDAGTFSMRVGPNVRDYDGDGAQPC